MVTFVAAALAADHVATAAPALRPGNVATAARQLAGRLVVSFRRVVPSIRLPEARRDERPAGLKPTLHTPANTPTPRSFDASPTLYPLPPPTL